MKPKTYRLYKFKKNYCNRLCTKYKCIHLTNEYKCDKMRNKYCEVFLTTNKVKIIQYHEISETLYNKYKHLTHIFKNVEKYITGSICKYGYHNQPCKHYYWCYLDYLNKNNSPVESELNNGTIKKYGHELKI